MMVSCGDEPDAKPYFPSRYFDSRGGIGRAAYNVGVGGDLYVTVNCPARSRRCDFHRIGDLHVKCYGQPFA